MKTQTMKRKKNLHSKIQMDDQTVVEIYHLNNHIYGVGCEDLRRYALYVNGTRTFPNSSCSTWSEENVVEFVNSSNCENTKVYKRIKDGCNV